MNYFFLIILWILATLIVTTTTIIIGKKYGVEYVIATMAALVVIAGILANKIVYFGSLHVPAGVIAFSMTFLITDVLSEHWSKKHAQKAVWAGLISNLVFIVLLYIAIIWPSPFKDAAEMFNNALGLTPRIILAGIIAYLLSQHHDVWIYNLLKKLTKNKQLWLRNNLSTIISQLIDSVVFITLAFGGVFPVIPLIFGQWIVKIIIAILDTPFIYFISYVLKKIK